MLNTATFEATDPGARWVRGQVVRLHAPTGTDLRAIISIDPIWCPRLFGCTLSEMMQPMPNGRPEFHPIGWVRQVPVQVNAYEHTRSPIRVDVDHVLILTPRGRNTVILAPAELSANAAEVYRALRGPDYGLSPDDAERSALLLCK